MNGYIGSLIETRLTRRAMLQATLAAAALPFESWAAAPAGEAPRFTGIAGSAADRVILPPGYVHDVVIRWGDALFSGVADLDTSRLAAGVLVEAGAGQRQSQQFGANCDAIQYFATSGGRGEQRGVLCVNNEYTCDYQLFPGRRPVFGTDPEHVRAHIRQYPAIVPVTQAANGISAVEVRQRAGRWNYERSSPYNRRITAQTSFDLRGPVRGAAWVRTRSDPAGTTVLGTFANCAGGRTPWGTYLSAEENIQDYFGNFAALYQRADADQRMLAAHLRWRMWPSVSPYGWDVLDPRFDMLAEPHEAFRFGWIVEVDPLDAQRRPLKRTALGRFAHEAATTALTADGRVAVYMGDDDRFEYIYKYVSEDRFDAARPAVNDRLLDAGTLYVARFNDDGSGEWLPLVYDRNGALNESSGFRNQAEVLIGTRAAADVLGATLMDRPEDIEVHPHTGRVYIACTRNELRNGSPTPGRYGNRRIDMGPNAANPRGNNLWGHILELTEQGDDHAARRFRWEVFLTGGAAAGSRTLAAFGSPDNLGFDANGNLWIVTDGEQPGGGNDGCYVCSTSGAERGRVRQFMSGPVGAEVAGCVFTPDQRTLFLSVQHPGENGTLTRPTSDWPDGQGRPPRSSVIAVRREDGGVVGT